MNRVCIDTPDSLFIKELSLKIKTIQAASRNNTVIYSALFGDIDKFDKDYYTLHSSIDYILITDRTYENDNGWHVIAVDIELDNPRYTAKFFKVFPHLFLSVYDISLWIDSNMYVCRQHFNPEEVIGKSNENFCLFLHNKRSTVAQEVFECILKGKDDVGILMRQFAFYIKAGFPWRDEPLRLGRYLLRRHNEKDVIELMELWWTMISTFSIRDQISLPYCIWKLKKKTTNLSHEEFLNYFELKLHNRERLYHVGIFTLMIRSFWVNSFKLKNKFVKWGVRR